MLNLDERGRQLGAKRERDIQLSALVRAQFVMLSKMDYSSVLIISYVYKKSLISLVWFHLIGSFHLPFFKQ